MLYYASWLDQPWVPVAVGTDDPQRDRQLASSSRVEEWHELALVSDADDLVDYLPNNVGVRLCSPRMRAAIDSSVGPLDKLQWLPATVSDRSGTTNPYSVLHLPGPHDFLDEAESVVVGDFVVKPVFSWAKVRGRTVLRVPESTVTLIVTDAVRDSLLTAACSGIDFEKAAARG